MRPVMSSPILSQSEPVVENIELPFANLPAELDGLTIAQLSDFHYHRRTDPTPIQRAVALTNALHPDLVVLTGDHLHVRILGNGMRPTEDSQTYAHIVGELQAPLGVFAVLGNHDCLNPDAMVRALEAQGIATLQNRNVAVASRGECLWIAGVEDALTGSPNLERALSGIP